MRVFFITGFYHRYFSHRSYRTSRVFQSVIAFLGTTAMQKGPLWWAGHHRFHHRHSDGEEDVHSPLRGGFWWAHVGWLIQVSRDDTRWDEVKDLARFPELRFFESQYRLGMLAFAGGVDRPRILAGAVIPADGRNLVAGARVGICHQHADAVAHHLSDQLRRTYVGQPSLRHQ